MLEGVAQASPEGQTIEPGVRGWLLLLVLWLGVIDPIYSGALNAFVAVHLGTSSLVQWNMWSYVAVRAVMRITAALALLIGRRSGAVWYTLAILLLSGPFYVLGSWMLFHNQVMPWALIRSAAVAAAWILYLLRSERVRATYGFGSPQVQEPQ